MGGVTLKQLREWYREAHYLRHSHRLAPIIVTLCLEVERLRQIADEQNSEYSDYTLMPFGRYAKPPDGPKKLTDVPNEYLQWWFSQNCDRGVIILEMDHGPYAQRAAALKKLRLHDYIKHHMNGINGNGNALQDHRTNGSEAA